MANYEAKANAEHPALVIFLLDISGSMGHSFTGDKARLQVVSERLRDVLKEMVHLSLKGGLVRPRYRIAVLAYSDDVFDVYGGIKDIDEVAKKGVPKIEPMNRTNTSKGLRAARKVLSDDLAHWSVQWRQECPAPMVIHLTDAEANDGGDPTPVVREIQELEVADGRALVANIYISGELPRITVDAKQWAGYREGEDLGNPYANMLLAMSSRIPDEYLNAIKEMGYNVQEGTVMMYPGDTAAFIERAFALSKASSTVAESAISGRRAASSEGAGPWDRDH